MVSRRLYCPSIVPIDSARVSDVAGNHAYFFDMLIATGIRSTPTCPRLSSYGSRAPRIILYEQL